MRSRSGPAREAQTTATEAPAKILGIAKDKVKLHDMLMGGGFGRRGNRDVDFIINAVLMAKRKPAGRSSAPIGARSIPCEAEIGSADQRTFVDRPDHRLAGLEDRNLGLELRAQVEAFSGWRPGPR